MSNYTISVPASSIQKAISYGANVSISGSGVSFPDGTTVTSVVSSVIVPDLAYAQANVATGIATGAYAQANAGIVFTQDVWNYANTIGGGSAIDNVARQIAISARSNTIFTQGVDATQNTWISSNVSSIAGVDATQNTRLQSIETINTNQNTTIGIIQGVDLTQNTRLNAIETINVNQNTSISTITTQVGGIQGVDLAQNSSISIIQGVNLTQNTRLNSIETNNVTQNNTINLAYTQANTARNLAQAAFDYANVIAANTATNDIAISARANTIYTQGVDATQNSAINYLQGVGDTQNSSIMTTYNFAAAAFARANTSLNGIFGTTGSAFPSGGYITINTTSGMTVVATSNTLSINTPQNLRTTDSPTFSGLTLTNPLALSQGGTGATSSGSALTALLPTGTTSGYVLTTGGPGTFYWASAGGGSSVTPGTKINSTRLSYLANGTGLAYTTPTYLPGASQLRVYFDGVRQFASEYTETSNTIVTFSSSPASGVAILMEVDGYIINPYYANNITFTAPQGSIGSSANTIQLAINDLESRKATLLSPTFTGVATSSTPTTNTSNTQIATTAFVKNSLNSGNTYTMSISGSSVSASSATTAGKITTANWTIQETGGKLYFAYGGVNKFSFDSSGNFIAVNNVTGAGTP